MSVLTNRSMMSGETLNQNTLMSQSNQHGLTVIEKIREWERNRILPKNLVTIKKASEITGSSCSFFKQLIREKKLNRYKINTATFVSLIEFEYLALKNNEQ